MSETEKDLLLEEQVRELLAENRWELRDGRTYAVLENEVLVRVWVDFPREYLDAAIRFLKRYVSADNWNQARAPRETVTSPLIGGRPREGVYRLLRVDYQDGEVRGVNGVHLIQVLVKGDVTQDFVLMEKNCRFRVSWRWFFSVPVPPPVPQNTVGVQYKNVFVNRSYDFGGWDVVQEKRERLEQQVSFTREISPAGVVTTTATDGKRSGPSNLTSEKGKIKTQQFDMQDDCTGNEQVSVEEPKNQVTVSHEAGPLVTEQSTIQTENPGTPTPPTAEDGVVKQLQQTPTRAGNLRTVDTVRTAVAKSDSASSGGPLATVAETFGRNQTSPASPGPGGPGVIEDVSNSINEFGRYDTRRATRTAVPKAGGAASGGGLVTVQESFARNAAAPDNPGNGGDGVIHDVSNSINEFGLYDTRRATRTALPRQDSASSGGPLVAVEETFGRNLTAPESPGQGSDGTIQEVSNSINEFGLFDMRKSIRTANPKQDSASSGGPLVTVEETFGRNLTAPESPGQGSDGTIQEVSNSINEFGRFDTRKSTRTANPKQDSASSGGPLVAVEETFGRNLTAPESPGAGAKGTIEEVSNSINEFGRFDTRRATRTALPAAESRITGNSSLVKLTTHVLRNQSTVEDAAAGEEQSFQINDFGLFDVVKRTASPGTGGGGTFVTYSRPFQQKTAELVLPSTRYTAFPNSAAAAKKIALGLRSELTEDDFAVIPDTVVVPTYSWVRWKETHSLTLHTTLAAALAAITDGNDGSSWRELAPGVYLAIKITVSLEGTTAP